MLKAALALETPQALYVRLMAARRGDPIEETLARVLASWSLGFGRLPDWLGLGRTNFHCMVNYHFPQNDPAMFANPGWITDKGRKDEMADLRKLLVDHRTSQSPSETWMADIVIAGCMGDDHLWQDLGLWQRADLSKLMMDNFEPLAKRNDKDMKWKKFLYKQLCETEGVYTCRAPSCEVCVDYQNCFGPEE
ncbi:MAG: nitrogen fixation protein NifQ [Candidatus Thiodiazotropha endolucinida]|nr:nitrogen fixation protein NifQ [Candidatus Thiodiazotropha endolucinida]